MHYPFLKEQKLLGPSYARSVLLAYPPAPLSTRFCKTALGHFVLFKVAFFERPLLASVLKWGSENIGVLFGTFFVLNYVCFFCIFIHAFFFPHTPKKTNKGKNHVSF